jgi:hypothetical protein
MSVLWRELMDGEVEYRIFFTESNRYMVGYDHDYDEGEEISRFSTDSMAMVAAGGYVCGLRRLGLGVPLMELVAVCQGRVLSRRVISF